MNLLVSSAHPDGAGLQSTLAELLLDRGAAVDGIADDSSPLFTALAFGYKETAETLVRRGAKITNVVVAASLGRLDLVREWVIDKDTLSHQTEFKVPYWVHIPIAAPDQIARAMVVACRFGRAEVARFLIELGVAADSADHDQMTALTGRHVQLDIADMLFARWHIWEHVGRDCARFHDVVCSQRTGARCRLRRGSQETAHGRCRS
jgi:hypothetical protein